MSLGGALAQAFVRLRVDSSLIAADTSKGVEEGAAAADVETAGVSAGEKAASAFNKAFRLGMIGVLAAAAVGAVAVKEAVDFQTQMTRIQTQAGASAGQVKQLSAAVLALAPSTQQGPMALAEALYHLKSVGLDDAQAMSALKTASDLAAVGGSNLEQTTNVLAAAWRSGIQGAQNFGQAAATVNAIVGAGNMTMAQLVSALSTGVLSSATTFGVSMRQVGGAIALLTDAGVPAARAGTELRMSLSLLGAASPTAAKQLATIGLTSNQLGQALRTGGFVSAIGLLRTHLKAAGLTATQTAALLSRAFGGGESSSAIMTMINNFSALKKKEDQISEGMTKYGSDVAAQRQTIQAQLDILRSSVETVGIRMGSALLPPFTKLIKYIAADLIPGILRFASVIGTALKNPYVEALVAGLIAAAIAIKTILVLTEAWKTAQMLLDAAMEANPIGIVIVAVAALAAGIAVLWERSATFRNVVEGAFRAVKNAAMDVWDWIKSNWKLLAAILLAPFAPIILAGYELYKLVGIVADVFDSIKKIITGGFDSWWASHGKEIEQIWSAAWGIIKAIFQATWGEISNEITTGWHVIMAVIGPGLNLIETLFKIAWGAVASGTRATWDLISGVVKAAFDVIAGVVKIGVAGVESVIKIAWDLIVGLFDVSLDLITGHWGKAWTDLQNTATQIWNAIKGFFSSALSDFAQMFVSAFDAILGGMKSWGSDLVGYMRQVPGMILHALGDVGKILWNAGIAIIQGLIGGIKSAIGGIGHIMGSVASAIKSFLPFSPAKQGPLSGSGDPYYSGLSIGKKIAAGITASLPALKSAVSGSVAQINSALSTAASEQKSGTSQLSSLTSHVDQLQALRAKEEASIKSLIAARQKEEAQDKSGSAALRKSQEDEIKSLEQMRSSQETSVKQTDTVISTLKKSMTALKDEVTKLQAALKKATAAAASAASSSSSDTTDTSTDDSSSSDTAPATPNWGAFGQWLGETGPQAGAASGGSWQGNPGPLGGFGLAFDPGGGPRPVGRFDGPGPFGPRGGDPGQAMVIDRLDQVVAALYAMPAKNAAGTAAALNGVTGTAITRGNW
jgi:TP901 family phage tail tape measure protein